MRYLLISAFFLVACMHSAYGVASEAKNAPDTDESAAPLAMPTGVTATVSVVPTVCGNDGSASVIAGGGTAPYTYLWSNGASTSSITNLVQATYTVTVTDMAGATATDSKVLNGTLGLGYGAFIENEHCGGDGYFDASGTLGTPPYTYLWYNGATTSDLSNLVAGSYTCTVTDDNGCTMVISETVPAQASVGPRSVDVTSTGSSCGAANSASATMTGAMSGSTYLWSTGATTQSVSGLAGGNYTVTVTDGVFCSEVGTVTLGPNGNTPIPDPAFEQWLIDNAHDDGSVDGSIPTINMCGVTTLDVSSSNITSLQGIEGFVDLVTLTCRDNDLTSLDVTAISSLEHLDCAQNDISTLDVTGLSALDILDCSENLLTALDLTGLSGLQELTCSSNQLGILDLSPVSSITTLECNSNSLANLALAGLTSLEVLKCSSNQLNALDLSPATSITTVECNSNSLMSLTLTGITSLEVLKCNANQLGTLNLSGQTGLTTLNCSNNSLTSLDFTGLNALTSVQCSFNSIADLQVSGLPALQTIDCSDNSMTMLELSDLMAIDAVVIGNNLLTGLDMTTIDIAQVSQFYSTGNVSLTCVLVNNVAQANAITNLSKDAHTNFEVTCPCVFAVSASTMPVSCAGGSDGTATAVGSSGTTPYLYLWDGGQTNAAITGLSVGTYSVTATDADGCTATTTIPLSTPGAIEPNSNGTDGGCSNGIASVAPTGGSAPYTYMWSTGATTASLSGMAPAIYTVTITDNNSCVATASIGVVDGNPTVPTTQLRVEDQGIELTDLSHYIYTENVPNVERYQFRVVNLNTNLVTEVFSPSTQHTAAWVLVGQIPNVQLGADYSVQARAKVGGNWGCYGAAHTVSTPENVPATQLTPAHCSSTLTALNNYIYWGAVGGAQRYGLEITGPNGFSVTAFSASNAPTGTFFSLGTVPGIQYNTTYNVRIRTKVGGVWHHYGPICTVTTPTVQPTPSIAPSFCGTTVSSMSQYISFSSVPGAQRYQHEYRTASGTLVGTRSSPSYAPTARFFAMVFVPNVQANTTYKVAVRAKVAGAWGNYGTECAITTPTFKQSSVVSAVKKEAVELRAMPNPTHGASTILLGAASDHVRSTVRNMMGQVVSEQQHGSTSRFEVELKGAPGVYFVTVESQEGLLGLVKLVKQ